MCRAVAEHVASTARKGMQPVEYSLARVKPRVNASRAAATWPQKEAMPSAEAKSRTEAVRQQQQGSSRSQGWV